MYLFSKNYQWFWRCSYWEGRLEQYEDEAVDEIIEEEERNVDADDSKVEPEDGKSCDRAILQTQEKDLKR